MAYTLNPTNLDPLKQSFPVEYDSFEGLTPKANEKVEVVGVPDPEVVVSQFDRINNGEVQLEVTDIESIAIVDAAESSSEDGGEQNGNDNGNEVSGGTEDVSGSTVQP